MANIKINSAVTILALGLSTACFGSVTLNFNIGGFSDENGTPKNGMPWGIVVDSIGEGFGNLESGGLIGFSLPSNEGGTAPSPVTLEVNSGSSGLLFYRDNANTAQRPVGNPPSVESGVIGAYENLNLTGQVSAGDRFGLLFFSEESASFGSFYGFVSGTTSAILPSDGATVSYADEFAPSSATLQTQAIPEPSAYATILGLLGLGYAVFCRRRRSSSRE